MAQVAAIAERFEILRPLGEGGMGVVYEALDRERGVRVAIKMLRKFSPEGLARLKREFRALEGLHHRNLVSLGELVANGDRWFFTMELVRGIDFLSYVRPWYRVASSSAPPPERATETRLRNAPTVDDSARGEARRTAPPPESDDPRFDPERLRDALGELTCGLTALHEAGRVHRDVKPSNVLVTGEGRVVLLDFGIVGELEPGPRRVEVGSAGTPAYMAPEQATGAEASPAADWYSVGVVLYEALTGQAPFRGDPLAMLAQKHAASPVPPSALVRGLPEDLEGLCLDLLRVDPSARPTGAEVLRRLGAPPRPRSAQSWPRRSLLVGREAELRALREAFEAAPTWPLTVVVEGESGIGKTHLVRRFVEQITAERADVLLLRGRCHEREAVRYKALDDVVDLLSQRLSGLADEGVLPLVPTHVGALTQVFPVLLRVRPFADGAAKAVIPERVDPTELRKWAFTGLRDLLARLAARGPTVVVVDDLHWADPDSHALLAAILRPPDAPRVLLIATARDATAAQAALPGEQRLVRLARLAPEDARDLAAQLLGERGDAGAEAGACAATIAAESAGHPLFIDELVRHAQHPEAADGAHLVLDDVLWARIERLAPGPRSVTELVAVAGAPLPQAIIGGAAELDPLELAQAAALLRAASLVRTGSAHRAHVIEPYHDRVREAVIAHLTPEQRRRRHEQLAIALEQAKTSDVETLAAHWREAGHQSAARHYLVLAAEQAWRSLAFDRAAEGYEAALALSPDGASDDGALRERLGDALASAGRPVRAARAYEEAASRWGPGTRERLELQRRAAEQYFRGGRHDDGLATIESVLAAVGVSFPKSPLYAVVQVLFFRALLALRGLRYVERDASHVPPRDLLRIDACGTLTSVRGSTEALYSSLFQTRMLLLALRAGERGRVARALSGELSQSAWGGSRTWKRTRALMVLAKDAAVRSGSAQAVAWATSVCGFAHFLAGDFVRAGQLLARGIDDLESLGGRGFELSRPRLYLLSSLLTRGRLRQACAQLPGLLAEAEERGEAASAAHLRLGSCNLAWLVEDDVAGARRNIASAMAHCPRHGFHVEHFYELWALTNLALYERDAASAARLADELLPAFGARSIFRFVEVVRKRVYQLRARCALGLAVMDPTSRPRTLRVAERMARRMARRAWMAPAAAAVRAGVAHLRGDPKGAARQLRAAIAGAESLDFALDAVVGRYCLGVVRGGDEGAALQAAALEWLEAEGVKRPRRFVAMMAPAFVEPATEG